MSGNAERLIGFPTCPRCNNNRFWTAQSRRRTVAFFVLDSYVSERDVVKHKVYFKGDRDITRLDDIVKVQCQYCRTEFKGGVCNNLVKQARRLFHVRRAGCEEE